MERWIAILEAFISRNEWGIRELAASIGLSSTATHRTLHEMSRTGLLAPAPAPGRFRVGPELARLAVLIAERIDVRIVARAILREASEAIGETVILALYSRERRQFWAVDAVESNHTIRYIWESLRSWNDLYLGASGKGILAFLPNGEREAILATLPDREQDTLRVAIDRAQELGFVVSHGERFAGAVGVSAPIRDATGQVIGDLIASWPDNRTDVAKEASVARVIVAGARQVSLALGYIDDRPSGDVLSDRAAVGPIGG
jgi:IclR family acetate operon transcriptional repressor